jgi:hypothetical protein
MRDAITELLDRSTDAPEKALAAMPNDFAKAIHTSIAAAISKRLPPLAAALEDL